MKKICSNCKYYAVDYQGVCDRMNYRFDDHNTEFSISYKPYDNCTHLFVTGSEFSCLHFKKQKKIDNEEYILYMNFNLYETYIQVTQDYSFSGTGYDTYLPGSLEQKYCQVFQIYSNIVWESLRAHPIDSRIILSDNSSRNLTNQGKYSGFCISKDVIKNDDSWFVQQQIDRCLNQLPSVYQKLKVCYLDYHGLSKNNIFCKNNNALNFIIAENSSL